MQRKVNEQTIDVKTGKRKQKVNPLKYNIGDLVLTDCNVTGSNYGTASKPKFPLMELWTTVLLPELDLLVKLGGPCEGEVVVHQETTPALTSTRPTKLGSSSRNSLINVAGS
jgi:hypothetical protein